MASDYVDDFLRDERESFKRKEEAAKKFDSRLDNFRKSAQALRDVARQFEDAFPGMSRTTIADKLAMTGTEKNIALDAKVAGHTAILPTMQADRAALDELGDDERLVFVRVARRMWEAVGDDYVHDVANVVANIDPHWCEKHPDEGRLLPEGECRFTSRSDQPVSPGWHAIEHAAPQEDQDDNDETTGNIIPANLVDGVSIAPVPQGGATLSEGKTKPPKPFTEATLLAAMEHASRWVEDKELKAALDDDESHSGGIGTPATRADVIEKLIRTGYVERKGKQLRSTEQGRSLIDVVAPKLKDVALTAGMERRLSEVEHGQAAASQVETEFRDLAARIPADAGDTSDVGA